MHGHSIYINDALQEGPIERPPTARGPRTMQPAEVNWRSGPFGRGAETGSPPRQNGPPVQLAGSHGAPVTAGPRQLGTKAAGQAGSPRRVALVEPHAASTSLLSQRLAHPAHRPGRARPRGPSQRRPAAVGARPPRPASGLPAGCLPLQRCLLLELCLPALSARALLQRVHPCSGPVRALSVRWLSGVLGVPRVALGGSRNAFGGEDLNGRPVLSFDRFFQCHPLSFAAS